MVKFSKTDQISCRYGLDELPVDITKRELLYFFSFNPAEIQFVREKGRFSSYQIVVAIHLGAYRFIGRPQYNPEITPAVIVNHVAASLKLGAEAVPLVVYHKIAKQTQIPFLNFLRAHRSGHLKTKISRDPKRDRVRKIFFDLDEVTKIVLCSVL